jgi:phosphate transport system protein
MTPLTGHTVKSFDENLERLQSLIVEMGRLCESQIAAAVEALVERDAEAAVMVIAADARIDALEAEAEALAIEIIALRAPVADDLRAIIAALKISSLLERVGDYAKNIAKRSTVLARAKPIEPMVIVPEMGRVVIEMLQSVLSAYVDGDAETALAVWQRDSIVDDFYNSLFRALLTFMMENPQAIAPSAHLLFIAKNLERIGDHATNIAELVHYSATGIQIENRPKRDQTAFAADGGSAS